MNDLQENKTIRTTLRVSPGTIAVSSLLADGTATFEPYDVKNGVSLAANMRQAIKETASLQRAGSRLQVMVSGRTLLVPASLYDERQADRLFAHSFPGSGADTVLTGALAGLNCVVLFAINKDLKMVIDDRFADARYVCSMAAVWRHLHQRSLAGIRGKLYAYFHDGALDVFAFRQNRFKFCNTFDAEHSRDALYFLMYTWKQLTMDAGQDELHIAGDIPDRQWLTGQLGRFIRRVYIINPASDFNRSPIAQVPHMPYDLMTQYLAPWPPLKNKKT